MKRFTQRLFFVLLLALFSSNTAQAIVVYDLRVDFSNSSNPNSPWRYYKGNTLLTHFTPVTQPNLPAAAANGFWGDTASSNNSAIILTTANGSATGSWTDNDFLTGEVLVRTTDPSTGGPMNVTWTAPSAGSFTYSGFLWFANAPLGPGGNSMTLSLNAGPAMEFGAASIGQDRTNVTAMVNGLTPVNVVAGDVLKLQLDPLAGPPSGSLAGVSLTIDFTAAIPEPTGISLAALGILAALRRSTRIPQNSLV